MSAGWSWLALASAMGHEGATQVLEEHARECFKDWKPVDTLKAEHPMDEPIPDLLLKVADVLHFLGRYRESNVLVLLSRWLRARGIDLDADLAAIVVAAERDSDLSPAERDAQGAIRNEAEAQSVMVFRRATEAYAPQSTETPEPSK